VQKLKNKQISYWNIPVSKTLDIAVEEAVRRDSYSTKSDFVRDATRRLLEKMNIPLDLQKKNNLDTSNTKEGEGNAQREE
jgi:Arc/MetJ-type ribon-helix-helix transcriptional regulator